MSEKSPLLILTGRPHSELRQMARRACFAQLWAFDGKLMPNSPASALKMYTLQQALEGRMMNPAVAKLQYVKAEPISLKSHPDFREVWLHDQISKDRSILGLGDLAVVERERVQAGAGRLDMLLADADAESTIRYEVEIMLGPTDPSHIIRTIEYWDIERRRYPAYDHIAVLVAEQITARFLNVIALFAGSIPIIAIQLNALRVGNQIVLDFVKVLDQRQLREDDGGDGGGAGEPDVDRGVWDARVGTAMMGMCDRIAQIANEIADPKLELKYKKGRVALGVPGSFFKVLDLSPKQNFIRVRLRIADPETWVKRLGEGGVEAELKDGSFVHVRLRNNDFDQHEDLLRQLIHQAIKEKAES